MTEQDKLKQIIIATNKVLSHTEKLEICKRLYAAEHCQFTDCANKDCFECILEKYEEINDDEIEIID